MAAGGDASLAKRARSGMSAKLAVTGLMVLAGIVVIASLLH